MKYHRINNPSSLNDNEIEGLLRDGSRVVVQYSKPSYTPELLDELNRFSLQFGSQFEIRFYSHYPDGFDASVISRIPDALSLSIDSLTSAKNLKALSELRRIEDLSLGVYDLDDGEILSNNALRGLKKLSIGESKKLNVDLRILGEFKKLSRLHVTGHSQGIESLVDNESLIDLSLGQIRKGTGLSFVSRVRNLQKLQIILGGRDSIAEINNPNIQEMNIVRVRGLSELGNLARFKQLRELKLEDQIRISSIRLDNSLLDIAKIINCKTLSRIDGIELLPSLKHLRISRTAIDYEKFKSMKFPKTLKTLAFYTGKRSVDRAIRNDLDSRGYNEYDPPK